MRLPNLKIINLLRHFYYSWPHYYDGIVQLLSFGQWERWQNTVFEDLSGNKILEIGVGPGKLMVKMAKKGYTVTGIEIQCGMAYEARRRVKEAGLDIDILNQSVYKMPFKDNTFDCVVLTFVLAEIDNLDKAVVEIKRVLKDNGKFVAVVGGIPKDKNRIAMFFYHVMEDQSTIRLERDNEAILKKYGFSVTRKDFGPFNMINKLVAVKK